MAMFLVLLCSHALAQEGKLESIRSEVRDTPASTPEKKEAKSNNCDDSWFPFSGSDLNLFPFLENLFSFHHNPDNYEPTTFVAYPYAEGWPGLLQIGMERNKREGIVPSTWEHLMSVRVSVEEGNNFNAINRLGVAFLADTMTHIGMGGSVNRYEETRNGHPYDNLTIGDGLSS